MAGRHRQGPLHGAAGAGAAGGRHASCFASPEYGVAPGQAAVLYAGDRVLGGGWIAATEGRAAPGLSRPGAVEV